MPAQGDTKVAVLDRLIREVKPSLGDTPIRAEDSLVEQLGLDSLDTMQLARKVRRTFGPVFDPQAWAANHPTHHYSVTSLLEAIGDAVAVERTPASRPVNARV